MASSIETTSTTTTLKNNGNTYATVDTNDDVTITNDLAVSGTLNTAGVLVHNDAGAAVDFRVEGDTQPFLLFASGTEDKVGIKTSGPVEALQVNGAIKVTGAIETDTANSGAMGYQSSKYRFISWGGDNSTKGAYSFEGYSANGSVNGTHLGILADGKVGINKAAPVTQLHIEGGGTSLPATTGTTPSAGTTLRIRPGNNAILDIGGNSTSGAWLQSYDQTGMQTEYPLLLNPNGGNVGIGTASTAYKLDVSGAATATPVTNGVARIQTTGSNPASGWGGGLLFSQQNSGGSMIDYASITGSRVNQSADNKIDMVFATGDPTGNVAIAERMRIKSDGRVFIGTTSEYSAPKVAISYAGGTHNGIVMFSSTSASASILSFFVSNTTHVGNITTNGSSSTSYNTSSDYRLKENVEYDWDATTRLKQLKPARFNFLADPDNTVDGFMAHEAQEVVPEAVTGFKDEVDDDDKPVMQGIDQAKLVPLLVKTIQELEARIAKLEGSK